MNEDLLPFVCIQVYVYKLQLLLAGPDGELTCRDTMVSSGEEVQHFTLVIPFILFTLTLKDHRILFRLKMFVPYAVCH